MADDPTKPVTPYTASNALLSQPMVRRPLWALAILLIVIELAIFFTPKALWLFNTDSEWASVSLLNNPIREEVFEHYALHSLRDAGLGPDIRGVSDSLKPVIEEAMETLPRRQLDVLDCAYPDRYRHSGMVRDYERNGCDIARDWLIARGQYTPAEAQPHTFITATFLHAGLIHLAFNVLALLFLGALPMLRMGFWRFLAFFILAGIAGALAHAGLRGYLRGSILPMVGASGAIMACLGLHWRIIYERRKRQKDWASPTTYTARKQLFKQVTHFLWADLLFIITASFISGEAHIGGLLFGFFVGHYFMRDPNQQRNALKHRLQAPILKPIPEEAPA